MVDSKEKLTLHNLQEKVRELNPKPRFSIDIILTKFVLNIFFYVLITFLILNDLIY